MLNKEVYMSEVRFSHTTPKNKQSIAETLKKIEPSLAAKHGVTTSWEGETIHLTGKGISGAIQIKDKKLDLHLSISWWLRPFSSQIEAGIREELQKHF
jgi:putative polyhydroxyalkanoate system protein